MGSERFPVQTKGIFHNLPTFDPEIKGLTAIVTGANGISGFHTMRVLLESPQRWQKVWAASRRPPPEEMMALLTEDQRSRVEHVACDFLSEPSAIAKQLRDKGVTADAIFFYSYAQPRPDPGAGPWTNAQELADTNTALLRNLLGALDEVNIKPKRFLLQTGAKNYGVHLGQTRTPLVESDPRVTLQPNFYYSQEDALFKWCQNHPGTNWNVVCPDWIIGAVNNAAMNALHPLAVYAAVQARKGEALDFPGDIDGWLAVHWHSTAMQTGYLSEWIALEDKCKDQKFNAQDTCPLPNNRLWPELARWYGCKDTDSGDRDDNKIVASTFESETTPLGYGGPRKSRPAWTLSAWAQDPSNHKAWKDLMQEHHLSHDPFEDIEAHFAFGDMVVQGSFATMSMNKAQSFGWTGHVDTLQSLHMAYDELNKLGMLPPMVAEARPLV